MNDKGLPNCAKIATGLQVCITCLVLILAGAWATWGVIPYSIEATGVIFGPILMLCVAATLGLWKGKLFGWVTAILGSAVIGLILYFTAGLLCILPAVFFVFLLSPKVREFYVRDYYE
jgi:hypothetical protein